MAKSQRKVGTSKSTILADLPAACTSELAAVELFERLRWNGEVVCPKCAVIGEAYKMTDAKTGARNKRFLWLCRACGQQFTVKISSVMQDSRIPLRHWAFAYWAACASKKGVSALQIQKQCHLSYRSALFLMHRVRWSMRAPNKLLTKLGAGGGTVEFDETYVGGKPRSFGQRKRIAGFWRRPEGRRGPAPDFKDRKTPVVAGVERGGMVKAQVVTDVTRDSIPEQLFAMVDSSAHLMTDESRKYERVGVAFASHQTVHHKRGEYARGNVSTNTIEGFFAGLKRQIGGTHHHVSKKHLQKYVDESAFKYNTRHVDDGERIALAIQAGVGQRLTYKDQTGA